MIKHSVTILLFITITIVSLKGGAQESIDNCLKRQLITNGTNDLDTLSRSLLASLPDKDFYMVGEAHTFIANNDLQWSLIQQLHERGVYNVVNELPHATCFLFNQYLVSGDESILAQLKPEATYEVLKKVRKLNAGLPEKQRIRYYGIDYLDARYDFSNYRLSLKIILAGARGQASRLDTLIEDFIGKDSLSSADVAGFNKKLSGMLSVQRDAALLRYGNYYYDLLLMSSNIMVGYKSHRDQLIFKSFLVLYDNLKQQGIADPRFLSFYGVAHLSNLGSKLSQKKESPVFNSVCRIGIKYFNCIGGWHNPSPRDEGIYSIDKKQLQSLKEFCRDGAWKVGVLSPIGCMKFRYGDSFDAVVIFNNYGARSMNSWKFD